MQSRIVLDKQSDINGKGPCFCKQSPFTEIVLNEKPFVYINNSMQRGVRYNTNISLTILEGNRRYSLKKNLEYCLSAKTRPLHV